MKFVKGVFFFLVLCLAAYGAFELLKKPPKIDVCESDFAYLEGELGIVVQNGQAADSGLSGILSDVEGLPSVGASMGSSFGGGGNSAPPSFMAEPVSSFTPPPFMDAPRVAAGHIDMQPVLPVEVFLPPGSAEPVESPVLPQAPFEPLPFDTPSFDVLRSPSEMPPIAAAESPPPWMEGWDGPADFPVMPPPVTPPPAEFLQSLTHPPSPIAHPLTDIPFPASVQITRQPIEENVHKVENGLRRIGSNPAPVSTTANPRDREHVFSSSESIPLDVALLSSARYTRTSSRQPLMFEPVRPETSPTAPVVAFAPPRRPNQVNPIQPPEQVQQPDWTQQPVPPQQTAVPVLGMANPEVKQIGTPRLIENVPLPVVQPAIRDTIERFVHSQRQLAESGDPDSIRQAFIHLSQVYELDQLEDAERALMLPILDSLALRVIYARGTHVLEPPYRVKPGETAESIARDFNLPPALLRKINNLGISQELPAGTMLKVVYGQFDARISIQRRELTLLLGGLYAGRFSFSLPNANIPVHRGEFYVTQRTGRMLTLNNGWILATNHTRNATIILTEQDAREIFDILSEHSVILVE